MEQKKTLNLGILVLIIAIATFSVIYYLIFKTDSAIKPIPVRALTPPNAPEEVRMITGNVEKISGQSITVKNLKKISANTVTTVSQTERLTVTADNSTIIEQLTPKEPTTTDNNRTEETFGRIKITLDDIRPGDSITVFATMNISKVSAFTAEKIEIKTAPKI